MILEQDETVSTVLSEQLARVRATIKKAEWAIASDFDNECPWCGAERNQGHTIDCEAFTVSGIPK